MRVYTILPNTDTDQKAWLISSGCRMILRAGNFLLLSLFLGISVLVLYVMHWRNTENVENAQLREPQKHIPGLAAELDHVPGPDKILGSLVTHVFHPERREHVHIPESDPGILVSVKTTTTYHRHRLSLLLFTWMESLPPQQVYDMWK